MTSARLYFASFDADNHANLWVTDGTAAGTAEIPVAGQGTMGLYPGNFTPFAGRLAFSAGSASATNGLYRTDGTAAGTSELAVSGLNPAAG